MLLGAIILIPSRITVEYHLNNRFNLITGAITNEKHSNTQHFLVAQPELTGCECLCFTNKFKKSPYNAGFFTPALKNKIDQTSIRESKK